MRWAPWTLRTLAYSFPSPAHAPRPPALRVSALMLQLACEPCAGRATPAERSAQNLPVECNSWMEPLGRTMHSGFSN